MAQPTASPTSPWGAKATCVVKPFRDMMDEEYAKQLEETELREGEDEYLKQNCEELEKLTLTPVEVVGGGEGGGEGGGGGVHTSEVLVEGSTDNDLLLARLLQMEYDKENDQHIRSLEKNYNGSNKVTMSFRNFYSHGGQDDHNSSEFREQYYEDEEFIDTSEDDDTDDDEYQGRAATTPGKSKHGSGGEIVTKHDSVITERKNTKKIEQFSTEFNTGEVDKKIRLPNHVFNKLKLHSMKEEKSDIRLHEKQEHATYEKALDEHTRLILYKMLNNAVLDSLEGIVATGKESVLIYAKANQTEGTLATEYALKVYKTTLNEFKTREKYIKEDYRFKDRFQKQNPRKIIRLWAEKEFRNLQRMREAGIACPEAVLLRKHVVVLSFIGADSVPAPKLKDAPLNRTQLVQAYLQCCEGMKMMFEKCNLIHADLSEYNVLWHDNRCVFIDVSQSVEPTHAQAFHFLYRDCNNITRFFTKAGVVDVMKVEELFKHVCGRDLGTSCLDDLENECKENFEGNEEHLMHGIDSKNFAFDYHFKQNEANLQQKEAAPCAEDDDDDFDDEEEGGGGGGEDEKD